MFDIIDIIILTILLIFLFSRAFPAECYANNPYTVPYMNEQIAPNINCVYPRVSLLPYETITQT